jgi:hypothetical protein
MRAPLSKQRNKHLQTVLIAAAKMARRNSPELAMVYELEKQKGNANRATTATRYATIFRATASAKTAPLRSVCEIQEYFFSCAACQVSSVADWATERKLPMPHRIVSRLSF